jgi:hypothetical protein
MLKIKSVLVSLVLIAGSGLASHSKIQAAGTPGFQPTAPYYTTFYYNWFKNPTTDGTGQWAIWKDPDAGGTHSPPTNWFSNYLPTVGLYSSNDYTVYKYQMEKLAEAKQEVVIASWWGQGDRSDTAFRKDITDFANRSDNPYPNLRWGLYYECEGGVCGGTDDPSVAQIVSDLNYISSNYGSQPGMLRVNGKLVVFVYADATDGGTTDITCTDSSMTSRWYQARAQADDDFYIVLKVFGGYASGQCQPDSWHQYAPAVRSNQQGTYSYMISPGFWRSGDAALLGRDLPAFKTAVQSMVASNTTWKLVETWNEWGEGTSIEPGLQVIQAYGSNAAVLDPNGVEFGNSYVDAMEQYLPGLEAGTGYSAPLILGETNVTRGAGTTSCDAPQPTGAPNLFEVRPGNTSATLYFTPPSLPYNSFYVTYGTGDSAEQYGAEFSQQGLASGALSYTINSLSPNTKYNFKVRAGNICKTGEWSNTVSVKTSSISVVDKAFATSQEIDSDQSVLTTPTSTSMPQVSPKPTTPAALETAQVESVKGGFPALGTWFSDVWQSLMRLLSNLLD